MKKFKFTLQTVHKVREMKQEKELLRMKELQTEVTRAAEQIELLEESYRRALESYGRKLKSGQVMNIGEMELEAMHLTALDRQKQKALDILNEKKRACAEQSAKLAAAAREVKITDRLRENQALRHRLELARVEQNALDEIVSANFARQLRIKQ
ncbi:MAG: flagellar export protein FliJ [Acidobacteria bacterium]|nr:flagellar export protein FliJ [Acidobacteriota bacterium]